MVTGQGQASRPSSLLLFEAGEGARLIRTERTVTKVRWAAALFSLFQVLSYADPFPDHLFTVAIGAIVVLVLGNALIQWLLTRSPDLHQIRIIAVGGLILELLVVEALVLSFTFDVEAAVWATIYLLPLVGAIRFQRIGAWSVTAAAAIIYVGRELWGSHRYHYEFLLTSITFRMGLALMIAFIVGANAESLLRERTTANEVNLELTEMNQSMRDFVSVASHDMRTPLSVIGGLARHMVDNAVDTTEDQQREYISVIDRQAQSLDRLVNDLLTTSNIEAGTMSVHLEDVELTPAVELAVATVALPDVDIRISRRLIVRVDRMHLNRMLVNFLGNAAKYGQPPIRVSASQRNDEVLISVADAGTGVPPEFVPRLFDRFARAATDEVDRIEGSGLGLAIVKGLAEANEGSVSYKARKPRGSVFRLRLRSARAMNVHIQ